MSDKADSSSGEVKELQYQVEALKRAVYQLDADLHDLALVCTVSRSFSSSDPSKVGESLVSPMVHKLNASKALVLAAEPRSYAESINFHLSQANNPGDDDLLAAQQIQACDPLAEFEVSVSQRRYLPVYWDNLPKEAVEKIVYIPRQDILWQVMGAGDPFSSVAAFSNRPMYEKELGDANLNGLGLTFWIPLMNRDNDEVIGIVGLDKCVPSDDEGVPMIRNGMPTASQKNFINNLAAQGARAMQNAVLFQELEKSKLSLGRQMKKLAMLYDLGRALSVIDNRNRLLKQILSRAADIAKAQKGSIMLFEDGTDQLVFQVVQGLGQELEEQISRGEIKTKRLKRGEGIAGRVAQSGQAIMVNDVDDAENGFVKANSSRVSSILCVPLLVHNDVIGVLNITNKMHGQAFTDDDLQIITQVADQAAVAINNARLYELAVTDGLTGVYIRRHLFQRLSEELKRARRYNASIVIIMVDIDFFKKVNDTYGHQCGDKVLKDVTRVLRQSVRDVDLIGRYGGEEFCLVLPNTNIEGGRTVAKRMHRLLERLDIQWEGHFLRISVSAGLSCFPEHGSDQTDLIRFADEALYESKRTGRNKTTVFNPQMLQRRQAEANNNQPSGPPPPAPLKE